MKAKTTYTVTVHWEGKTHSATFTTLHAARSFGSRFAGDAPCEIVRTTRIVETVGATFRNLWDDEFDLPVSEADIGRAITYLRNEHPKKYAKWDDDDMADEVIRLYKLRFID